MLERARSISPEKSVRTATPPSPERHTTSSTINSRPTEPASMSEQDSPATSLARSGTLSWQQRPKSSSGRKPLSFVAAENASRSPRDTPEAADSEDTEKSREDIAAALSSKDPTWFRQTADRGVGSAAYRRNQVEDPSITEFTSGQHGLPGMSRSPPPDDIRSTSPSRQGSFRNSPALNLQSHRLNTALPGTDMKSLSLDPPTLNPSNNDVASRAPNRSPSPTKGMGGFVQSAMLKRSDSVNKRWSAQASPGINRQGSTASNRAGTLSGVSSSMPRLDSRSSTSPSRGNSAEPGSRPTSSHDNSFAQSVDDSNASIDKDGFARPALPLHTRSKSVASIRSSQSIDDESTQPPSPSKRWSPTKSSWLESALNKPEEKVKATPPPSQPSWMSDLAKAKQQKNATSPIENSDPLQEETPKATSKLGQKSFDSPLQKAKSPSPELAAKPVSLAKERPDPTPLRSTKSPSPVASPKPAPKPDLSKPSEPGKFDFRSSLKSRQTSTDANEDGEPEFRNALGKLKRTQTQKYEAPDVLKSNIMQGKAALNITGGPAPRVKKDELKDSLVQRKKEMQAKAASEGPKKPIDKPDLPAPEALAKRKAMNKSESFQDPLERPKEKQASTPEALSKFRSVKEKAKPELPQKPSSPPLTRKETFGSTLPKDETPSKSTISRTSSNEDGPSKVNLFAGGLKTGASSKLADRFNPALVGMLARGPSPMGNQSGKATSSASNDMPSAPRSQATDEPGPGRELTHMTKGRARGPKRKAPSSKTAHPVPEPTSATQSPRLPSVSLVKPEHILHSSPKEITSTSSGDDLPAKPKPLAPSKSNHLSQMASPRLEETENVQPEDAKAHIKVQTSVDRSPLQDQDSKQHRRVPSRSSPTKAQPSPLSSVRNTPMSVHEDDKSKRESLASFISPKSSSDRWSKPTEPDTASTSTSRPWSTISEKEVPLSFDSTGTSKKPSSEAKTATSEPSKRPSAMWGNLGNLQRTDTLDMKKPASPKRTESPVKSRSPERHDDDLSNVSVKSTAAIWGKSAEPVSSPSRPKSPVKLPTKQDEEQAMRDAGLMPPPGKPTGLGITGTTPNTTRSTQSLSNPLNSDLRTKSDINTVVDTKERGFPSKASSAVTSPATSLQVPPESPRPKTPDNRSRPASLQIKAPPESPIPHTSEANRLFTDFFDERPIITSQPDFDTIAILEHNPLPTDKITTIRKQMQVVLGDGKLATVPQDQSHILYDDSMYVCSHNFSSSNGSKSTAVYLWAGSNVPSAAVDDAQLFARRAAKDVGGKLEVITQGKETPNFLQAVGGSLITFRGSPSRSTAAIPDTFMLCGRRHLGQITFDEVDFSLKSFCSAYPYIVSKDGKIYLWKGIGCHSDELGCALLIAMELGMTPDNQLREGEEPASFLSLFGTASTPTNFSTPRRTAPSIPRSADHWRHKPRCDRYRARLFRVSAAGGTARSSLQVSALLSSVSDGLRRKRSWSSLMPLSSPSRDAPASPTSGPGTPTSLTPNGTGRAPRAAAAEFVVAEIAPFTQADLLPGAVHVLDAFFEVYV